jgi:hypothetical protein
VEREKCTERSDAIIYVGYGLKKWQIYKTTYFRSKAIDMPNQEEFQGNLVQIQFSC